MTKKIIDVAEKLEKFGVYSWSTKKHNLNTENEVISTGSFSLNKALGIGGWPHGKIIEIFGNDSSGKSTLALHAVAEAQKLNKVCIYIDLENTLNIEWAKKINVVIDKLYIARPNNGEQAFTTINELIKENAVDLIIVDSVAAMVPHIEFENNIEDQTMGLHARLMSKGLRVLQSNLINSNTTIIFINQVREKLGNSFIPITTTTGGRALKYAASIRVEIKRCESIKQSEKIIGFLTQATIVKNKFGAPMQSVKLGLYFDCGFDNLHEIITDALNKKIIEKNGGWFSYQNKNIGQGLQGIKDVLKNDKNLLEKIEKEIREKEN